MRILPLLFICLTASAQTWTRSSPVNAPVPRSQHAMAYDAARGQAVLFGGYDDIDTLNLGDTWVWDGANWTQKNPVNSPAPRLGAAMSYDAAHAQVVLFGGTQVFADGSFLDLNDTWLWDGSNWTKASPQTSPSVREFPSMAYDAAHSQVIMFGGTTGNFPSNCTSALSDTWAWDGKNWTKLAPVDSPPGRFGISVGLRFGTQSTGPLWRRHAAMRRVRRQRHQRHLDMGWCELDQPVAANQPQRPVSARHGGRCHCPPGSVVRRRNTAAHRKPVERYLGVGWIQLDAEIDQRSGGPVRPCAMAFDSARAQTVLFAGYAYNSVNHDYPDTWVLPSSGSAQPSISNAISAGAFGAFKAAAPGSWIEIYGSNLAFTTRVWNAADFNGINAPSSLDGVQVTIGGQKGLVEYVSSGQINVQLPSTIVARTQQLTVTNPTGAKASVNLTIGPMQLGLLAPAIFQIGGTQDAVAQALI